jgi:hypothetical protein
MGCRRKCGPLAPVSEHVRWFVSTPYNTLGQHNTVRSVRADPFHTETPHEAGLVGSSSNVGQISLVAREENIEGTHWKLLEQHFLKD